MARPGNFYCMHAQVFWRTGCLCRASPLFRGNFAFFVLLREQQPSLFGLLGCELFPRAWAISPFLPVTPSLGPFPLLLEPCFD